MSRSQQTQEAVAALARTIDNPKPAVGRIVRYWPMGLVGSAKALEVAAIITFVFSEEGYGPDVVSLTAFPPGEAPQPVYAPVSRGTAPGTWSWGRPDPTASL